jgi:DNA repair exonuclease SbcCD nuclease subunit
MLQCGHIHEKKVDESSIIYPGSLTSIGFDELGEHGIVIRKLRKKQHNI